MPAYTRTMEKLISEFTRLPGIGQKSAERIVMHILKSPRENAVALSEAIVRLKDAIGFCKNCFNLSEGEVCHICGDPARDKTTVLVVESPKDILAIEKSGAYKGLYHVLLGAISPLDGVGPDDIKIKELMRRIKSDKIKEVILATDADTEGETTALYISQLLRNQGVKTTRIAYGLPVGSHLEYADQATLAKALEGRNQIS
ncbi:MAG: recombination protein RecR [Omnitrophica WOR_2 bacterium RIFCSPLOWO2_12_FULL_51_24]|nr:MAG: recombination protein RecR [Omnitrophica WOR_2 bacterium RIFCSPHIGHO2_01_FULL_49_10]OGX36112.1 MAG: recombination protein RecR [Omnitrophica WOR_2 bacterium RIFCSPLOWO2_02_FULL_50_19]OGX42868.1 MAG: recombination protein RecR [Omnitrophica WOR_2 bacterium RIFCSPLOWO2_12_FULL_51_24]